MAFLVFIGEHGEKSDDQFSAGVRAGNGVLAVCFQHTSNAHL